jgi:nucleoside 2-deoxyribosyltransferase
MKIYISGQITGIENQASAIFEAAESFLRAKGFEPTNPMKLDHNHDQNWESFMRVDIAALMQCDGIYMLDNHTKSAGAKLELHIATHLKMFVFHEDYAFVLDKYQDKKSQIDDFSHIGQY